MTRFMKMDKNFKFLLLEVRKQVESSQLSLRAGNDTLLGKIINSEKYIDNLVNIILKKSFADILHVGPNDESIPPQMMAFNAVVNNLERIGDFASHIVRQIDFIEDTRNLIHQRYNLYYESILPTLDLINTSLFEGDLDGALSICKAEKALDDLYKQDFAEIMKKLQDRQNTHDLITQLFIFRYLERMGDSLLNIGEAIISVSLGVKMRLSQYLTLKKALHINDSSIPLEQMDSITRSGCAIGKIHEAKPDGEEFRVIFKEGKYSKVFEENLKLQRWQSEFPSLTPKVLGFEEHDDYAILLLEYLDGSNFRELLLAGSESDFRKALDLIIHTADFIWQNSMKTEPCNVGYIGQLSDRLKDVFELYPDFHSPNEKMGDVDYPAFDSMIKNASEIESAVNAPFSVLIHGDYNADNILFDSTKNKLYYIDLHRSCMSDYVQDVSVFLISSFRLPVLETKTRDKINETIKRFYGFASDFAVRHGDKTFNIRLTLGLIRSFISSTRFELKKEFAQEMYLRGVYLLEKILQLKSTDYETFVLPDEVLVY